MSTTREAYIDSDILDELAARDLEVQALRAQLHRRGHQVSTEGLYERLVHLEGTDRVRIDASSCGRRALWGAL